MARRGVTGQLNMFDFFKSLEDIPLGEVEMVSLMPKSVEEPMVSEEPKPTPKPKPKSRATRKMEKTKPVEELKPVEEPKPVEELKPVEEPKPVEELKPVEKPKPVVRICTDDTPVMSRSYEFAGEHVEIAYLKYNKVRICRGSSAPEIKEFETTKDAVDYYVEQIQELEADDE